MIYTTPPQCHTMRVKFEEQEAQSPRPPCHGNPAVTAGSASLERNEQVEQRKGLAQSVSGSGVQCEMTEPDNLKQHESALEAWPLVADTPWHGFTMPPTPSRALLEQRSSSPSMAGAQSMTYNRSAWRHGHRYAFSFPHHNYLKRNHPNPDDLCNHRKDYTVLLPFCDLTLEILTHSG